MAMYTMRSHFSKVSSLCIVSIFVFVLDSLVKRPMLPPDAFTLSISAPNGVSFGHSYPEPPQLTEPRVPTAICTIQKDGEAYLDEWVFYNLALGFSKIFIYDNSNNFDLDRWSQRHANESRVEVFHYPGQNGRQQMRAYNRCLDNLKANHPSIEFVAFYDLDEFLVLKKHDNIEDFVRDHCPSNCTNLIVNWQVFGSNGESTYAPVPILKRFQYREKTANKHVKSIARVNVTTSFRTPHCAIAQHATMHYDTLGHDGAQCPFNTRRPTDVAVLQHFYTKSEKEWQSRCARGRADATQELNYGCKPMPTYNDTVFDDSAWQFLKQRVPTYEVYEAHPWMFGWNATE